jgi:cytochrome bd-type quinol oxidase subunit 2
MMITTTATTTSSLQQPRTYFAAWIPLSGLGLVGVVLIGSRRKNRKAGYIFTAMALMLMLALAGCGGSHTPVTHPGTPPGSYTVTTTATSPNVSHATTFTLVVN